LEDRIVPSTFFVSPTGNNNNTGGQGDPFLTIQHAITVAEANPGADTIMVEPGTYTELLTIQDTAPLTIQGTNTATAIVQAPASPVAGANGTVALVNIQGATTNAELRNLTLQGPNLNFGVFVSGSATANIHDNVIKSVRLQPLDGSQTGVAILVGRQAVSNTAGTATIANNTIQDYQKAGIVVDNTGSSATITGNSVTGQGSLAQIGQNGIQISDGATATVIGNTVTNNQFNGAGGGPDPIADTQSAGIILFSANNTTVSGNTASNNDVGIYNFTDGSTSTINGNILNTGPANRFEGIFLDQGVATVRNNAIGGGNIGIVLVSFAGGGTTANSQGTLTGNTITGSTVAGVQLLQETGGAFVPQVTITSSNTITSLGIGVDVSAGSASVLQSTITATGVGIDVHNGATLTSVQQSKVQSSTTFGMTLEAGAVLGQTGIFNNDLSGSAGLAVNNLGNTAVRASGNWWGSNTQAGVLAKVSTNNVDVTPWLNSGTDTDTTMPGFQGDFSFLNVSAAGPQVEQLGRINEGISLLTSGGTVNVQPGTYTESVQVTKALTLQGATGNAGDAVINSGGTGPDIFISNSQGSAPLNVTVQGMTLTGGTNGLTTVNSGNLTLSNLSIHDNTQTGIAGFGPNFPMLPLFTGTVTLTNVNSVHNGGTGVTLNGAFQLTVTMGTYANNTAGGLALNANGPATVSLNSVAVNGNGASGLIYNLSGPAVVPVSLAVVGGSYSNNTGDGIKATVTGGSSATPVTLAVATLFLNNNTNQGIEVTGAGANGAPVSVALSDLTNQGNVSGTGGTLTNLASLSYSATLGGLAHTITITPGTLQDTQGNTAGQPINFSNVPSLGVGTGAGNDTFNVTASTATILNLDAGPGTDTLNFNASGVNVQHSAGQILSFGRQAVNYTNFEVVNITNQATADLVGRNPTNNQVIVSLAPGSGGFNAPTVWTTFPATVNGQPSNFVDDLVGDFNGDGFADYAARDLNSGQWFVALSNGSSAFSTPTLWTTWAPLVTNGVSDWVDVQTGDFNGDGMTDIVGRILSAGQFWVSLSNGTSFTAPTLWTTWEAGNVWRDVRTGDFNGDHKSDIAGRLFDSAQWYVGLSSGSNFVTYQWDTSWPAATWVDVQFADFNGDGKTDIAGRDAVGGQWRVSISNAAGTGALPSTIWTTWVGIPEGVAWANVRSGDFNGDGRADLAGWDSQTGVWWVSISTGTNFATAALWTTWQAGATFLDVRVGDFNGDGLADLTGRLSGIGVWVVSTSTGSAFSTFSSTAWDPTVAWTGVKVANFA
jgi:parallel beta-helix repeat protein